MSSESLYLDKPVVAVETPWASDRTQERNDKREPKHGEDDRCLLCHAPVHRDKAEWFVLFAGGGLVTDPESAKGLNQDHGGYMDGFVAGPTCARKIKSALRKAQKEADNG